MREYTVIVKGERIPVRYEVYKAYYQEYEHERYLKNKAAKHEYSLEQFIEAGVSVKFTCLDSITPVEGEVLKTKQIVHLYRCLDKLGAKEQTIIHGISLKKRQKGNWLRNYKYRLRQLGIESAKF